MDDLHRAPGDGDRKPVRDRIARALADGRISSADAEIRLTNVASAQSLTELSLLTRDLDQLEAAHAATTRAAESAAQPAQSGVAQSYGVTSYATPTAAPPSSGRMVPLLILGLVFALVVAGGIALFVFSSGSDKDERGTPVATEPQVEDDPLPSPRAPGSSPSEGSDPGADPGDEPAAQPFELSAAGVKSFLAVYQQKFSTTKAVELTMYDTYAIARVPVPGKKRYAGWIYRDGEWSDFGGVSANFPGSESVDLRKLDVAALMRNIAKARRTLNVEDYNTTYVTLNYRPQFDEAPNVNIYVSNEFSESGYLATTLQGKVERTYAFGQ